MSVPQNSNYYELLEVSPSAPQHEIHAAFQRAKKTYGTTSSALYSVFSQEEAQQLLRLIEEAFSVLGNHTLRKEYDEKLRLQKEWGAPTPTATIEPVSAMPEDMSDMAVSSMPWTDNSAPSTPSNPSTTSPQASMPDWGAKTPDSEISSVDTPTDENVGVTSLSRYTIDPEFEEEISQQEIFDGSFLKKIREYKNVSLMQLSESTKVSRTYLNAVEENSYNDLPAPVFVRGFIIQIAKILKLDEKAAAASYLKLMKSSTSSK